MKFEYITTNAEGRWEPLAGAPIYKAVEELCAFMSMADSPTPIVVKLNGIDVMIRRNSQCYDVMEKWSLQRELQVLRNKLEGTTQQLQVPTPLEHRLPALMCEGCNVANCKGCGEC